MQFKLLQASCMIRNRYLFLDGNNKNFNIMKTKNYNKNRF